LQSAGNGMCHGFCVACSEPVTLSLADQAASSAAVTGFLQLRLLSGWPIGFPDPGHRVARGGQQPGRRYDECRNT
jgi:hypothetical protein